MSSLTIKLTIIAAIGMILLSLAGCGKFKVDADVKVDGKVDVEHSFNLNDLKAYFKIKCQDLQPADDCYSLIIDECTECMVGDFLETIGQQ